MALGVIIIIIFRWVRWRRRSQRSSGSSGSSIDHVKRRGWLSAKTTSSTIGSKRGIGRIYFRHFLATLMKFTHHVILQSIQIGSKNGTLRWNRKMMLHVSLILVSITTWCHILWLIRIITATIGIVTFFNTCNCNLLINKISWLCIITIIWNFYLGK